MTCLPPPALRASLDLSRLNRPSAGFGADLAPRAGLTRRSFLAAVGAGVSLLQAGEGRAAPLVFSPDDAAAPQAPAYAEDQPLQLGQIPQDFWARPRELWLRRHGSREEIRLVYWRDGKLLSDGYWQACALLRDVHANVMTTMDPTLLDVLRGITGYYQAWRYPQPIVLTSGFRTVKTNRSLVNEGSAWNSMHLYGRASDMYVPGIPQRDIGVLGMHLQQGGVGFYPSRKFTHLDTGRLRTWVGA